jgi:tetratricopeptide (TPR) repeat protein
MNADESSGVSELQRRFPAMKPLKNPPGLFTLNGFGLGMYGNRAADPETRTYIKTRCICAIFIPVLALDAFRVADAGGGGWYFLGKEKLGTFASLWRKCMLVTVVCLIGSAMWNHHIESPEYRAEKAVEKAVSLVAAGKPLEAAGVYGELLREGIGDPAKSTSEIKLLLGREIASGDPKRVAAAVRHADENKVVPGTTVSLIPDLADQALAAAAKCSSAADAEHILTSFSPDPADLVRVHEALRKNLESLHRESPGNQEVRIKLALMREEFGEIDGALALLEPAADKLGDGDGARLFGNLLLNEGRVAEALPHLESYVQPRVGDWQKIEHELQQAYEAARTNALEVLNRTEGPPGFRSRYDAADEAEQARMVEDYLAQQTDKNPAFLMARKRYQAASKIVPSLMDLGVARLRLAQAETDPAKRKELLSQAEEALLALKGAAGDSDDYRFFLGQIYFWSGREPEGRSLFDELLKFKERDFATLYALAVVYRDLGEDNDARKLLEEAYQKAVSDVDRSAAARLRSLLARNTDEKIEWLAKGSGSDPMVAINLAQARAEKAEESGDNEGAKRHYREALAGYEKLERSSASLNNSAIIYSGLFRLEGKREDIETAARLFSEAFDLQPANSILSFNAADSLLNAAVLRVVGERIHPKLLQFEAGVSPLTCLYQNESGKEEILKELKADPNFRKALSRFWEALLLAPKNTGLYAWGTGVFQYIGDLESLERLLRKAEEQEFDFSAGRDDFARFIKGERDGEIRNALKGQRERVKLLLDGLDDPRARAMAQSHVAVSRIGGFSTGESVEGESWLAGLRSAAEKFPCSRLNSTLATSLEIIALENLARDDKESLAIIEANRRLLDSGDILRLLVRARGALGERVRNHPAVKEAREAAFEAQACFPSDLDLRDWLLLDGLRPEADAKLEERVKADRLDRLSTRLQREIQFEGPSALLGGFWLRILDNDEAGAKELLPKLETAGLKMPQMF